MRKARNYWQETCAVLAIVAGLVITGCCWADTFQWPPNTIPTPTDFQCNAGTGNCKGWSTQCQVKGTSTIDKSYFSCGSTIWNSLQVVNFKAYGYCDSGSGSCTKWGTYWCLNFDVFGDNACSPSMYKCSITLALANLCDPNNPTGQ